MKKKSIIARVGVMAAALTLATTSLMSGTLARYTTNASVTAKAIVAKWGPKFKVAGKDTTEIQDTVVDLTDTTNYTQNQFTVGSNASGTLAANRIAPGTSGSIPITLDMTESEVNTQYEIRVQLATDSDAPVPENITFQVDSGPAITADKVNDEGGVVIGKGTIKQDAATKTISPTLKWTWPFYTNSTTDEKDTEFITSRSATDSAEAARTVKLKITITAMQADATKSADYPTT